MSSVTKRIKEIKQPYGGYVPLSDFSVVDLTDGCILNEKENLHTSIIGMTVDYMTRFITGTDKNEAFQISLTGAQIAVEMGKKNYLKVAEQLLDGITGLDDNSIVNACKLTTFDVWKRNTMLAPISKSYNEIKPDKYTIKNIQILIERSVNFLKKYGPITNEGFTFEPPNLNENDYRQMIKSHKGTFGGYTSVVSDGDGDFLTKDTLWDFKVSKSKPTSKHTLQLLMYWIMGQHSGQEIFKSINRIGIFNPRLNKVYLLDMKKVSSETIKTVENDVICYE